MAAHCETEQHPVGVGDSVSSGFEFPCEAELVIRLPRDRMDVLKILARRTFALAHKVAPSDLLVAAVDQVMIQVRHVLDIEPLLGFEVSALCFQQQSKLGQREGIERLGKVSVERSDKIAPKPLLGA